MCLSALLSEKEDISLGGLLAAWSKPLKGTLQVYTTRSESSGLRLDTFEGEAHVHWRAMATRTHKHANKQTQMMQAVIVYRIQLINE